MRAFSVAVVGACLLLGVHSASARSVLRKHEPLPVKPDPILARAESVAPDSTKAPMMTISTNFLPNDPQESEQQHQEQDLHKNLTMFRNLHNLMVQEREESRRELCRTKCKCVQCACCRKDQHHVAADVQGQDYESSDSAEDAAADVDEADSNEPEDAAENSPDETEDVADSSDEAEDASTDASESADADSDEAESSVPAEHRVHYESMLASLKERQQTLTRVLDRINSVATMDAQQRIRDASKRITAARRRSRAAAQALASETSE